ncbi:MULTISPECIES: Stp1/IreP family PP2C-type Ser/Thr phosphatase [Hungatella]|uniref:Stp1/IreP family PP2C-type Ser/Thr phosphatase n=1 Tax=Hungatella hathewayi TaxID=154046 RepID=A0AAW9W9U8_9FIRM|nr:MULTISPECIES: Stp1/IreP family PP2C-type Ser/Thr phosphatase [Hungatella]MCD7968068.1 Stp1/IreP family PP2C-type Ser/Thr phosphatase [Clostridiaceae bacterium]MCQ4827449.1 Stp1/IreP family PP2C-type Ser/Thr phosphatase [Hungatella sp. SL.1.14]MUB61569.1 Stp1/IreP family PP2C-type Ser/Thr phosphatase [Hungatella hathewayi]CUP00999.1 protein serine/threonine phosphatase [Hungatella hathewayi]
MKACALTDTGRVRTANQDYVYASVEPVGSLPNLFVVADGMGGHQAGDYASRYIVENLVSYLQYTENSQIVPLLREAILKVNTMLYHEAKEKPEFSGMGTTLVAAVADENTLYVANVGDSRLYLVRDRIRQVTRDHSYVEELVSLGRLERGSKDYKDKKNIITRAVGTEDKLLVDFFEAGLEPGDYILMCSDGLSNMLEDAEMEEIIGSDLELQEKAEKLITVANDNGGKDNIAVVLVDPQIGREGSL